MLCADLFFSSSAEASTSKEKPKEKPRELPELPLAKSLKNPVVEEEESIFQKQSGSGNYALKDSGSGRGAKLFKKVEEEAEAVFSNKPL